MQLRGALDQNQQFSSAIDSMTTGVVMVDPYLGDSPITFINRGFELITGYSAAEAIGRNCRFLQGPDTDRGTVARLRECLAQRRPFHGRLLNYRKDGTSFCNSITVNPVFDAAGKLVHFVGLQQDASAEQEAEDEIQARALQAATVAELGQRALAGAPLDALFDDAVEAVARTLDVELCRVNELLNEGGDLLIRAGCGWNPGIVGKQKIPGNTYSLAGCALKSGKPFLVEDLRKESRYCAMDIAHAHGAVSGVSVIISGRAGPFGTLGVMSRKPRRFTPEDISFLQGTANVLAAAIDRRRDEEALRKSEARYQRIADNLPGMVYQCVTGPEGVLRRMTFVSEGCREIFDAEPAALYAHPQYIVRRMRSADRAECIRAVAECAVTLQPCEWQGRIKRAQGVGEKWVRSIARPERQPDGSIVWDGLLLDITERKRTDRLEQAKVEAERANEAKSEFLSRMSHELRTPLNAILGFGQLLQIGPAAQTESDSIEHILNAGRHLLKLVDEMLDLARIESGRLELSTEAVMVKHLLYDVLSIIRPLAVDRGITLHSAAFLETSVAGSEHVMADRQRLKQVMLNLVSNAVKYNVAGGRVSLDWMPASTAGRLRIRVTDTGKASRPNRARNCSCLSSVSEPRRAVCRAPAWGWRFPSGSPRRWVAPSGWKIIFRRQGAVPVRFSGSNCRWPKAP